MPPPYGGRNKKTTRYETKQTCKHYVCHDVTWPKLMDAIFEIDPETAAAFQQYSKRAECCSVGDDAKYP